MRWWPAAALAAGFLVCLGPCGRAPAAAESSVPRATSAPAAGGVRIEWKDSWDKTYNENKRRWNDELKALDADRRHHQMARRLTALVRALLARHGPDGQGRAEAYERIARDVAKLGSPTQGITRLKQLIAALPDNRGLQVAALEAILKSVEENNLWRDGAQHTATAEHASDRLIALNEAGRLNGSRDAAERAWRMRVALAMERGRLWEAARALDGLATVTGRDARWYQQRVELLLSAGRWQDARRLLEADGEKMEARFVESQLKRLSQTTAVPPDFPRDLGLEMRWTAIRSRTSGSDTAAVQALLDAGAEGSGIMPWEEDRHASTWVLLDRLLAGQKPQTLARLRGSQQRPAEVLLERAGRPDDPQAIVAAYRRYPWAGVTHEAMVACAEAMLHRGWSGLALRMFDDVLSHGAGDAVRQRAQVGVWLAVLNETRDARAVTAAFEGVAPDAVFPWMGGRAAAGTIRKRLLEGLGAAAGGRPAPRLGALSYRLLRLPPTAPWRPGVFDALPDEALAAFPSPLGSLQRSGDRILLAGPNLLACFGPDGTTPLWWRTPNDIAMPPRARRPGERGRSRKLFAVPGPFRPAMTARRVFSRWGADAAGGLPRGVAALDARTGEMLWSTDADPAWETIQPISDPAAADGRVYVLAIQDRVGPILAMHLVCMDAERGAVLWQRTLGSQSPALRQGEGQPSRGGEGAEQVRYGNAVTVHRGAVYCSTNLGFVARCDARDGMVEWVAPYPRAGMGQAWLAVLRRQGASPVVAAERVIFMPRDYHGVFALEARTGRRLWDAPLVPAEEPVGLAEGLCIVKSMDSLFALQVDSGRVVWRRRLPGRILGRPSLARGALIVVTRENLFALRPATGDVLEARPWGDAEAPLALAVCGRTLAGVSRASAGPARPGPEAAAPAAAPLALPVKRVWHVPRPEPWLWAAPPIRALRPEAKVPDNLYVASRGVLECVRMAPRKRPVWQRFTEPDLVDVAWAQGTLIFVCERRLVALDAETGATRWVCNLPFQTSQQKAVGPHLAVVGHVDEHRREPMAALVALSSGRLVWGRRLPNEMGSFEQAGIARDGDHLYLVSADRRRKCVHATLRADDGETVAVRSLPLQDKERILAAALGDEVGFYLTDAGALYEFPLTDPEAVRRRANLENFSSRAGVRMNLTGAWLKVVQFEGGQYRTQRQWVFRSGDPSYKLYLDRYGEVRGDVTYTHEGATLKVTDLGAKKEVTYTVPVASGPDGFGGIFDFHRMGDRMWIASLGAGGARNQPATLRLDTFDAATGVHRAGQTVPGVFPQASQYGREEERRRRGDRRHGPRMVWTPEAIFVTDRRGLHALATAPKGRPAWGHRTLVARSTGGVTIDGELGEWDDGSAVPLGGEGPRRGRLHLAHDAENLYLAVRCDDASFVPHVGSGDAAGGDWLEIGLTVGARSYRWGMGAEARGRLRLGSLTERPLPEGLQGAVRHDPSGGQLVYEAAIPSLALSAQPWDTRHMGLSLAVWDEQPGGGPTRVLTWGDGVAGRDLLAAGHQAIYIDPLTPVARRVMRSIADELPDLPEAFAYVNEFSQLRATSARGLLALASDFLVRRPKRMTAKRLLALDRALRVAGMADPSVELLARAAASGVPETVRRRYASLSQAYLSQWVYVPGTKQYPRSIVLELFDGVARPRGWGHRVYWVKPSWQDRMPAVHLPERFPNARWHEARIPLVMLGMTDLPICGIRFGQQGEPGLVWDRTAVVSDGKEEVFLDDSLPAGAVTEGSWRWIGDPVHSGTKAHSPTSPDERYKTGSHGVRDFKRPVMHHLRTPPGGPYVSQWVYLDAKDPPRTVSLGLHDGRTWCFNAIWGEMTGRGRYMGPLPEAGRWQELRLPLAWTPLDAEPISGFYFAHVGGRAVWDRTALVAGGKTHVVIDDDVPPAPAGKVKQGWAPWADNYVGGATVAPGKVDAALECDGWTGQVEVPHSPALEPARMTIEAWIFPDRWTQSGDIRRWIVNKNTNDTADGHYALVVNGMQVGAYLNIGGKEEGKFQVWSGDGRLTLRHWHHVAMTFDERDLKVYHNGRLAGSTPVNRKRNPGRTPLHIGGRQDGYHHFGGRIDEVRLYGRALSQREVLARYESGGAAPAKPDTAAAAYWGFDEAASPADLAEGWQWVQAPVKSGKRAHTQTPADGYAGHCCLLTEPILAHLPYDAKHAVAVLRRHVPALGSTGEAWRMVQRMLQLSPAPAERAETCKWFLARMPGHWHAGDALAMLLDAHEAAGAADAAAAVEADLKTLSLPRATVYAFHRRHTHRERHFVRSWQVLGPFPNPKGRGHDTAYAPESEGVDLGAACDGAAGRIRWKAYTSPWEFVSLYAALGRGEPVTGSAEPQPLDFSTAYAVCWVHADAARQAVLQVGHNDTAKVWINRQLLLDGAPYAMRSRPEDGVLVDLPAGWSEVLVKTSNEQRTWQFYVELADPLGRGRAEGVTFSTAPPAKTP